MDMVCEKTMMKRSNFDTDAIQPYIDGEWVKAKGTTLGPGRRYRNGKKFALLEDNSLQHGPIESFIYG